MKHPNFVAYYGIRMLCDVEADYFELDKGTDPRAQSATESGLDYWFGCKDVLLIGTELALYYLGGFNEGDDGETTREKIYPDQLFESIVAETKDKLARAGFKEEPSIQLFVDTDP